MITREEIENKWIEQSEKYTVGKGYSLCRFLAYYGNYYGATELKKEFSNKVWHTEGFYQLGVHKPMFMTEFYFSERNQDQKDMTYLLRALTLNILLDDNAVR